MYSQNSQYFDSQSSGMARTNTSSMGTSSNAKRTRYTATKKYKARTSIPAVIRVGAQPFPKVLKNTLRYADAISLSVPNSASPPAYHVFRCNGLFDPNHTGTGHQPLYFDNLMAIYDHYFVETARIEIKVTKIPAVSFTWGVFVDDDVSPSLSTQTYAIERSLGKQGTYSTSSPGSTPRPLFLNWDARKAFGVGNVMTRDDLAGTATADPSEIQTFIIWAILEPGASTSDIGFSVQIDYGTYFNEFATVAAS